MRHLNVRRALLLSSCVFVIALSGCGGGGGGTGARPAPISDLPPPPPPPPPAPAPSPTPSSVNYNDTEYSRSNGAVAANAISAYNAGGRGQGVKIAVLDSGINPNLPDFAGRIDPASADLVASRGVTDTEGHGTAVAAVAAASRNGSQIQGVAFESTILSFNSADPNNCDKDDGCKHSDRAISQGIDLARTNGARVINISLGGEGAGFGVLQAVTRATQAGIVIVVSAGNGGQEATGVNPDAFASQIANAGSGLVIIAGAHDAGRAIAGFSNRAGTSQQAYLAALGDRVRSFDHNGQAFMFSGTSFSAPVISGAAALLASAFPNLSGQQIVQILLSSADDAGATGTDATFGRGILNLTRAFAPQGATALAGSQVAVSTTGSNGQASGAMGDAKGASVGAVVLDGYGRAYRMDVSRTVSRAAPDSPLAQALGGDFRTAASAAGNTAVSLTVNRDFAGQTQVRMGQIGLGYHDAREAKAVAGMALSRLSPKTAIAFGFAETGRTLQQRLTGHEHNAFLVARDPLARNGFFADASSSAGLRHLVGPVGVTVTGERGRVQGPGLAARVRDPGYSISSVSFDRRFGPALVSVGASRLVEESTMLGGRFGAAFASGGAASSFVDTSLSYDLGGGWGAFATYRRGWTRMAGTGALVDSGRLSTDAWAFDLSRADAFSSGDRIAFRMMQPLRVRSGGFDLSVPNSYDYSTGVVGYEAQRFSLAPSGREMDYELAYSARALGGRLGANLFLRTDPGHVEAADSDIGGAIRFTLGF
ncbi:MAG TPA: S8 family peptidase [Allosphingosinicella sp.]